MQYSVKMVELIPNPKEQQDQRIREIISESTQYAEWLPIPEEFHSGEEMGFDLGGVSIRGNVVFDKYGVTVNLTSPVVNRACRDIYHRRQTFFSRNPPRASLFVGGVEEGPAIPECIEAAKELLVGLYTDWFILQSRKESIRLRLKAFPEILKNFADYEKARVEPIKKKIKELSRKSGENKGRFKRGEITQPQYIENKRPLHDEIVSLMAEAREKDPFRTVFSSELDDCEYAMDKKKFIESI